MCVAPTVVIYICWSHKTANGLKYVVDFTIRDSMSQLDCNALRDNTSTPSTLGMFGWGIPMIMPLVHLHLERKT